MVPGIHQFGYGARVAIDAIAVWDTAPSLGTSSVGDVWTARYDAVTEQWLDPIVLDVAVLDATHAQIAMDAAGNAFVVWMQDNDATDGFNDTFDIRARRYDAAAEDWSPEVLVQDTNTRVTSASINLSYESMDIPALAIDPAGNALLAWSEEINGDYVIRGSRYDISAPQPQWGAPEPLSDDAWPFAMFPSMAIDAAGNAIVVWQAGDNSQFGTGDESHIDWNRYVAPRLRFRGARLGERLTAKGCKRENNDL